MNVSFVTRHLNKTMKYKAGDKVKILLIPQTEKLLRRNALKELFTRIVFQEELFPLLDFLELELGVVDDFGILLEGTTWSDEFNMYGQGLNDT